MTSEGKRIAGRLRVAVAVGSLGCLVAIGLGACAAPEPMRGISSMGVIYSVPTEEPIVVLTLDDGPNEGTTPELGRVLKENGATATFFVVGEQIPGNEDLLRWLVDEGHELANHGLTRETAATKSSEALRQDLQLTRERLLPLTGESPRWFRPGSAFYHQEMLDLAAELGYQTVLADVFPLDFLFTGRSFQVDFILRHVKPGSIIALHDDGRVGERTAEVLTRLLPLLAEQGYEVMSLGEAMDRAKP